MPYLSNLFRSMLCGTVSNAFEKSSIIISTCNLLLSDWARSCGYNHSPNSSDTPRRCCGGHVIRSDVTRIISAIAAARTIPCSASIHSYKRCNGVCGGSVWSEGNGVCGGSVWSEGNAKICQVYPWRIGRVRKMTAKV